MTELTRLIKRLQRGIARNSSHIRTIRHPHLLVASLQELNAITGNDEVKDAVATQIGHLIMIKIRITEGIPIKEDEVMLNTTLTGPPGVGKTLLGTKLAKIWYSLGYLDGSRNTRARGRGLGASLKDMFKDNANPATTTEESTATAFLLVVFVILLICTLAMAWTFYGRFGGVWTVVMIAVFVLLIIIFGYWVSLTDTTTDNVNLDQTNTGVTGINDVPAAINNSPSASSEAGMSQPGYFVPTDDQVIKVVTRADFVDKFVGWTDKKTNKLLQDNLGKVLFIDEAYSLVTDMHDSFGIEALSALNIFLSQHPKEIIVIFAGYKDLMDVGIFSIQPGLKRRCMWRFECSGYTADQLFDIFKIQLQKKGWGLEDEEATRPLFHQNMRLFPNYGGDTERLTFYSELEHSRDFLKDQTGMSLNRLRPEHVQRGMITLQSNNKEDGPDVESTNPLANMMQLFKKKNSNASKPSNGGLSEEEIQMINAIRNTAGDRMYS